MLGFGKPLLDAVFITDAIKDVRTEESTAGTVTILWQIGEGHTVIGEHNVDLIGEGGHDIAQEG
jgi:hypothetical protein